MNRTKKAQLKDLNKKHDEVYAALRKARHLRDDLGERMLYEHGPRVEKLEVELKRIEAALEPLHREAARDDAQVAKIRANISLVVSIVGACTGLGMGLFKEPLLRLFGGR